MKLKKIAVGVSLFIFCFSVFVPGTVGATTSNADLIRLLQAQIAELQVKVVALQKAKNDMGQASVSVRTTMKLLSDSSGTMSSDDVKLLQTVLSADSSIYPEGLVTGYRGPLTIKALKRFQKKNGLAETGRIDEATRDLLNKSLDQQGLTEEKDDNGKRRVCVAFGHFIAPGWKKHNGERIVDECKNLPPGIWKKVATSTAPTATTTDSTAPGFYFLEITGQTYDSAVVTFGATEKVRARVLYASSSSLVDTAPTVIDRTGLVSDHSVLISGLASGTPYYVKVVITDSAGNDTISSLRTFTTLTRGDITAPVASSIIVSGISSSSASISWMTTEPARTKIYFSSTSPIFVANASSVVAGVYSTVHEMRITGLPSATEMYFVIESEDVRGNKSTTIERSFRTLVHDTVAPELLSIVSTPTGKTTAVVTFTASEPTTGTVHYGGSSPLSIATALSSFDATLSGSHTFVLSGLLASTTYQYIVVANDIVGNGATSSQQTFTTLP